VLKIFARVVKRQLIGRPNTEVNASVKLVFYCLPIPARTEQYVRADERNELVLTFISR